MSMSSRPRSMPILSQTTSSIDPNMSYTGRRKPSRDNSGLPHSSSTSRKTSSLQINAISSPFCDLATLSRHPYFCAHHVHYACADSVFGAILCQLAIEGKSIHCHVFSSAGSMAVSNLRMTPLKALTGNLNQGKSDTGHYALRLVLTEYLARIPPRLKDRVQTNFGAVLDEDYVATLADAFEVVKSTGITESLLAYLSPKFSRSVLIDVIVPPESVLLAILPKPMVPKANNIEISKFPIPPKQENVEKRENLIHEILATERTYVSRLQHLLKDYAQPLRAAARKQKGILGTYETNNIFPTSLDAIFLLNQDFLRLLEGSSGDYEFALTLVNGFRDFRKVYSRYLETSSDLDQVLREALKLPKFREFTDHVRSTANANIGIRELVMEPISRIPRYSLLITSVLSVITPSNPAYPVFKEALTVVRKIGHMERDRQELSQEKIMKLAALVSSWPTELVKSSVRVISYVDCLDLVPFCHTSTNTQAPGADGVPCSLVLFADRLVILKRSRDVRIEEILQSTKKGELGYRGFVMLDSVQAIEGDDCMYMTFLAEISGVNPGRWTDRPLRKYAIMGSDAARFVHQLHEARFQNKACEPAKFLETFDDMSVQYAVYTTDQWSSERELLKSSYRLWQDVDDGNTSCSNLIISEENGTWSCNIREGSDESLLCRDVSQTILKNTMLDKLVQWQQNSWLNSTHYTMDQLYQMNAHFAMSLLTGMTTTNTPMKSRPTSPSKIMSSFLGRKDRGNDLNTHLGARPGTGASERSFTSHTIIKKKSNQLFNFGGDDRCELGIETFVNCIVQFDHFALDDFSAANATESKQINTLVALISKDPRKGFAILGSPSKVALHALKAFCRTILCKKLTSGCLIPDQICQRLRSYSKQNSEMRQHNTREIISNLPVQNIRVLRSLLRCALHVQTFSDEASTIKRLLLFSEMIVPSLSVTAFINTLEMLLQEYEFIFSLSPREDMGTRTSVISNMSLLPTSSRFGSTSSQSFSNYLTDPSSSSHFSYSPAKLSSFGGETPELVNGLSSPDGSSSNLRSPSLESIPAAQDPDKRFKRATMDMDYAFQKENIFGLTASEAHRPNNLLPEKSLPAPPASEFLMVKSVSDQLNVQASEKQHRRSELRNKEALPTQSDLSEVQAPLLAEKLDTTKGPILNRTKSEDSVESYIRTPPRRIVTPSKIPIPSPKVGIESRTSTPSHSRHSSLATPLNLLSSKKESSIPRLPSTLAKRRESQGFSRSFSDHSFTFDTEMSDSLNLALKYSDQDEDFVTTPMASYVPELTDSPHPIDTDNARRISREHLRREIANETGISSVSTIRRISRQLQKTEIGPLELPLPPIPSDQSSYYTKPVPVFTQSDLNCSAACRERWDLVQLELQHYKNLYRHAAEEIDITIDVANEQIAELHNAVEQGSVEATALGLLELEKEKNRKLILEITALRERRER